MKNTVSALVIFLLLAGWTVYAQQEETDLPVTVAYFYKVKWGYQDEFVELFNKNHYPVLQAQVEAGKLLDVKTYAPRFHGEGRSDLTFLVLLRFRNWEVMAENSSWNKIKGELYPDQETFIREEQRRFELLEAHWDVPLTALK